MAAWGKSEQILSALTISARGLVDGIGARPERGYTDGPGDGSLGLPPGTIGTRLALGQGLVLDLGQCQGLVLVLVLVLER
jgi:hypothetical protein